MLFRYTARKFGKVPIYISRERNICLLDVGQVYHGIVYALSGGRKEAAIQGVQIEGFTEKEYGMVRLEKVGDVLFQTLLLDDVKIELGKVYIHLNTIYIL